MSLIAILSGGYFVVEVVVVVREALFSLGCTWGSSLGLSLVGCLVVALGVL